MHITVRPATPERWDDLQGFFGPSGAYSNCWCTFFRQKGKDFSAGCRNDGNHSMLERLTKEGEVPGLLAYATSNIDAAVAADATPPAPTDGRPVGWVSVAPRVEFTRIMRSPLLRPGDATSESSIWSVVCFWMPRQHRGQGLAGQLLKGAVEYAAEHAASFVEGYPVDTDGQRRPSASLYTGTVSLFTAAGFTEAYRRNPSRPVMRRQL